MLLLLVATVLAMPEEEVGGPDVIGKPTEGQYYSITPLANINDPPAPLVGLTFNFDATITLNDDLTIEVLKHCHENGVEVVTRKELSAAYDEILKETGEKEFIEKYFGGSNRVNTMKAALKNMRKATDNHVAILSASWGTSPKRPWLKAPIGEEEWAAYLLHLTTHVGLGFDAEHIIGVWAPGPPTIPEKGEALEAYYKKMYGTTPVNVVHIDKFKYMSRILAVGENLLQPDPYFVQQFTLNELLIRTGGKQVGFMDILREAIMGRFRTEEAEALTYKQEASGDNLIVYGFAAVGVAALVAGVWKTYQNHKLAEHVPLPTNESEL